MELNPLKTKRRLLYLKTHFIPRSKHLSSRLQKPISLWGTSHCLFSDWHKTHSTVWSERKIVEC